MGSARVARKAALLISCLAGFGALVPASTVHARPKTFALNWVRAADAESCIASHELSHVIEELLGPVFVAPSDAELSIEGLVRHELHGAGWAARIVVSDQHGQQLGERELTSPSAGCHALDPQIVLVIALAIDPEVALEHLPTELLEPLQTPGDPAAELLAELREGAGARAQPSEHHAADTKPDEQAKAPTTTSKPAGNSEHSRAHTRDARAVRLALSGGFATGVKLLPKASAGPLLGVTLQLPRPWSIALTTVLWLENDAALTDPGAAGGAVHFRMALGTLSLCASLARFAAIDWSGCAGMALGVRWSDAGVLAHPSDATRWEAAPALSSAISFTRFEPFVFALAIAGDLPLWRERFTYRDARGFKRGLLTPGVVAAWGWLSAGLLF
jgi:hypothetical protein